MSGSGERRKARSGNSAGGLGRARRRTDGEGGQPITVGRLVTCMGDPTELTTLDTHSPDLGS